MCCIPIYQLSPFLAVVTHAAVNLPEPAFSFPSCVPGSGIAGHTGLTFEKPPQFSTAALRACQGCVRALVPPRCCQHLLLSFWL